MTTHYHVLIGLRGCYMPDTNETCETQEEARQVAAEYAEEFKDEDTSVTKCSADYYTFGHIDAIDEEAHCIEVTECDEQSCIVDLAEQMALQYSERG